LQLFYGKAYANFDIKAVFLAAIAIFELGSLVCGLAPSSHALIVGRAVAGLGGSGIFAGGLIIIAHSVPLHIRPLFIGLMGGMFAIASVCGPVLGGVFTDKLTWRWCFYINLPFGGLTIFGILFFFKSPDRPAVSSIPIWERIRRIDWLGLLLFAPAIVSLLLVLQWGGSTYAWNDARIIGLFVVFGVLLISFACVEYWKGDAATVPPRLITQRSVAAGTWYAFCNGAGFLMVIYYLPLWHQAIRDVSAVESGIRLLSLVVGLVIMVIISGALVTVTGYCKFRFLNFKKEKERKEDRTSKSK
jgi:MFS family permease